MRVKNLNGTKKEKCISGTWLAHWEAFSGQTSYGCFVVGCKNRRSVGGLVQKDRTMDTSWYIVPLCEECNRRSGQDLDIWDLAMLVPVHAGEASEKAHAVRQPAPARAVPRGSA